jgi:IS1 family transposase
VAEGDTMGVLAFVFWGRRELIKINEYKKPLEQFDYSWVETDSSSVYYHQ